MKETKSRMAVLRHKNNLLQKDIAKMLNVKENTYSKWEKCSNDIPLEKVNILANFYNVNLDYLLGISKKIEPSEKLKIDYKKICERLLELRKENHLTQVRLSDKIGFFQTTYSSFETGARTPTTYKLLYIVNFYNASIDYVVGRTDTKKIYKRSTQKITK